MRKLFPVSPEFRRPEIFYTARWPARVHPLALALLLVETTDLIFAVDSVPAIFSVTQNAFIVFTSNVFAILGLRSLYFLLAGALGFFRYLKFGLSIVLVFMGVKMLLEPHGRSRDGFRLKFPRGVSLLVVGIIATSILFSVSAARRGTRRVACKPCRPQIRESRK